MNYLEKFFTNKNQLYPELKPRNRIVKIVEQHIAPSFSDLGFKFYKKDITLKRSFGKFEQEIFFRPSSKNYKNEVVNFDPHFIIYSSYYYEWLTATYNIVKDEELLVGQRAEYIPGWDKRLYSGWYNLAIEDNQEIIEIINTNINNSGLPFLNKLSNLSGFVDYYLNDPGYYNAPIMVDFCLIDNNVSKAKEVLKWFWDFAEENAKNFAEETLAELKIALALREQKINNWA